MLTQIQNPIWKHIYEQGDCPICGDNDHGKDRCGVFGNEDLSIIKSFSCKELHANHPDFDPVETKHHFTKYRLRPGKEAIGLEVSQLIARSFQIGGGTYFNPDRADKRAKTEKTDDAIPFITNDKDGLYRSILSKTKPSRGGRFNQKILERPNVKPSFITDWLLFDPYTVMGHEQLLSPLTKEEINFIECIFPREIRDTFIQKSRQDVSAYGLIPAFNFEGKIHGFQQMCWSSMRINNPNTNDAKYKNIRGNTFNGTNYTAKVLMSNGALQHPLQVLKSNYSCNTLYLTEGILKPIITFEALDRKAHVMGAFGGLFMASTQLFAETLLKFLALGVTEIVFLTDSDWLDTVKKTNVISAISNTLSFAQEFGFNVTVADKGQALGLIADPDEVDPQSIINDVDYGAKPTASVASQIMISSGFTGTKVLKTIKDRGKTGKRIAVGFRRVDEYINIINNVETKVGLDIRITGAGKSYCVAKYARENSDVDIYYVCASLGAITDSDILKIFTLVRGRHDGLYLQPGRNDASGQGKPLINTMETETKVRGSNCKRFKDFASLREVGLRADQICATCPVHESCKNGTNQDGHTFLYDREVALQSKRIACTLASLPLDLKPNSVVFIDELSVHFTEVTKVLTLQQLITDLNNFTNTHPMTGLKYVRNISDISLLEFTWTCSTAYLFAKAREYDEAKAYGIKYQLERGVQPSAYFSLVNLFRLYERKLNSSEVLFSIDINDLKISYFDDKIRQIIEIGCKVIGMDSTVDPHIAAAHFGVKVEDLTLITTHHTAHERLKVKVYRTSGFNTSSNEAVRAERDKPYIKAIKRQAKGKVAVTTHKKYAKKGDLIYFADHRGANGFEKHTDLIMLGLPILNIGVLKLRHSLLKHSVLYSEQEYIDLDTQANILQTMGRLRASSREDNCTVHIFSNCSLPFLEDLGYEVEYCVAEDLIPLVKLRTWQPTNELKQYITLKELEAGTKSLLANGIKPTLNKLAEVIGRTSESVKRSLTRLKLTIAAFLKLFTAQPIYGKFKHCEHEEIIDAVNHSLATNQLINWNSIDLNVVANAIIDCSEGIWYHGFSKVQMERLYLDLKLHCMSDFKHMKEAIEAATAPPVNPMSYIPLRWDEGLRFIIPQIPDPITILPLLHLGNSPPDLVDLVTKHSKELRGLLL
jgi:hypothetical protein